MSRARRLLVPALALACPVLFALGLLAGAQPDALPGFVRSAIGVDEQAALFDDAVDRLEADYYRPLDRRALLDASLTGAVRSLDDRFSNYFPPREYRRFEQQTRGAFVGVGIAVRDEGRLARGLAVTEVYPDSPASRAGLRAGDVISAVEGRRLAGLSTEAATARIKGREGTSVRLTFGRDGRSTTKAVDRARVALPIVTTETVREPGGDRALHVAASAFTSGVHGQLGQAVRDGLRAGARGVVLDLRDNGGGLLDEAVLVASVFVEEGTVVSTRGRSVPRRVYSASGDAIDPDVPVVVLVNGNSASASEIVAGALADRRRATVVGTRTFGKGVFQQVRELPNGGALDFTVGEYFLPSGRNLGGGGVKPGAGIEPDVRAADDPDTRRDEALDAALRVLAERGAG